MEIQPEESKEIKKICPGNIAENRGGGRMALANMRSRGELMLEIMRLKKELDMVRSREIKHRTEDANEIEDLKRQLRMSTSK